MMRQKHPDKKNALSILNAASKQMQYTLTLESNDNSAFTIIRNIYECFRMLGDALLIAEGIESQDHVAPLNELMKIQVETSRSIKLVDNLRRMRHNINYYGYTPQKVEADDAISLAKACFEPLLTAVQKEIEGKLRERRLFILNAISFRTYLIAFVYTKALIIVRIFNAFSIYRSSNLN